jgi:uncharacterized protein (TIGR02145 family)
VGTAYGEQVSFTTFLPVVSTGTLTFISTTTAICSGQVTGAGSSNVTSRGVCWSTSQNPTINDSHTTEGSGLGSFTSYIFGLSINTTYYVRAYATNSVGTAYGEQLTITTPPSCGIDTISDYDGNIYHTVPIGQQCWMRENLRTTHFADGAVIPDGSGAASSMQTPYRYIPNGDSLNIPVHGYLYNWPAVMHGANPSNSNPSGVQGICPWGWHIPSKTEFNQLVNYLGSQPQYVCGEDNRNVAKALSATTGWQLDADYCTVGNNPQTNNASGFTAFPSGAYYNGFMDFQTSSYFWSATQIVLDGNYNAYQLIIHMHDPHTTTFWCLQRYGASVRCLRN